MIPEYHGKASYLVESKVGRNSRINTAAYSDNNKINIEQAKKENKSPNY